MKRLIHAAVLAAALAFALLLCGCSGAETSDKAPQRAAVESGERQFAQPSDMEKYEEAKSREHNTMIRSRQIAADLGLQMKIGDVEYQGDGNKAIFYYIADERVDFRQLIKVLADTFHVRIEMKHTRSASHR